MRVLTFFTACALAGVGAAHAEPGGTSGVSGPGVTEGQLRLEVRTAAFEGGAVDGNWAHRAQAAYGVTDWWRTTLNFRAAQPSGENVDLRSVGLESTIDIVPTREWPVHFGLLGEYKFGVDDVDDAVEFKLLAEHQSGALTARLNLVAERDLTDGAEWEHGYGARAMWRVSERWSLGVEGFGEHEASAHAWGPRAQLKLGHVTLAGAALAGLGDAESDVQFRLGFEYQP